MGNNTIVKTTPPTADINDNYRARQVVMPGFPTHPRPVATELDNLIKFEELCGQAEGRSPRTIELTILSLKKLRDFLSENCLPTDLNIIGVSEIREFILRLKGSKCFNRHPYAHCQDRNLSSHTINIYLRSLRAAWNRWLAEGLVTESPFSRIKIARPPHKVIATYSEEQLEAFFNVIDTSTPTGQRDLALTNMYLDTAARLGEITGIELDDIDLNQGKVRLKGKGGRERTVPFGIKVRKQIWKYINGYRPEPQLPGGNYLYLTSDGWHLSNNRVEAIFKKYSARAGISGVRASPHTFRHTACLLWIRNGGDLFSLQQMTGHSSLTILRGYVNLSESDISALHRRYSPVDNLQARLRNQNKQTKDR